MAQTRKMSALESATNIVAGIGVAFGSQIVVFPWFGIDVSLATNIKITAVFTAISFVRQYLLRRAFNWWQQHSM